jgi:hypothetical protein
MRMTSLAAVALLAALCSGGASLASAEEPYVVELDVVLSKKKGKKPAVRFPRVCERADASSLLPCAPPAYTAYATPGALRHAARCG